MLLKIHYLAIVILSLKRRYLSRCLCKFIHRKILRLDCGIYLSADQGAVSQIFLEVIVLPHRRNNFYTELSAY